MPKYNKRISHKETTVEQQQDGRSVSQTTEKTFFVAIDQDEFYMSYVKNLAGFFQLTSATDIKLLVYMCTKAEFNTGKVIISQVMREDMAEKLDIHTTQISRSLRSLKAKKIIHENKGEIQIDPLVFWKGSNDARKQLLKEKGVEFKFIFSAHNPKEEDDSKVSRRKRKQTETRQRKEEAEANYMKLCAAMNAS